MGGPLIRFLRAVSAPALSRLRLHWRAAVVVSILGVLTVGLLGPVRTLAHAGDGRPGLALPEIPSAGPELMWASESRAPSDVQEESLRGLLQLLTFVGWLGFGVAAVSIFSCRAAEARERAQDTAVRRAVGASRKHLLFSLAIETTVLAAIALVIGLAVGAALLSLARLWWPGTVAALTGAGAGTALALAAVLGAAGLASLGLLRSREVVETPPAEVSLKIPAWQVAVAVALLMGSVALLSSPAPKGLTEYAGDAFATQRFQIDSGTGSGEARSARYAALIEALSQSTAGVSLSSAGFPIGLGTSSPVTTACGICYFGGIQVRWPALSALVHAVSADSFKARGIPLLEGRTFGASDGMSGPRVAIVNRNLALRYYQGGDAVGRDIFLGPGWPNTPYRVIGIVDDQRAGVMGGALQPRETVYLSVLQHPPERVELLVTGKSDPESIRRAAASLANRLLGSGATVTVLGTLGDYLGIQLRALRWIGAAFGVTGAMVLLMALLGTVATSRMWANSLAWEMALRRAVGATRNRMRWFVIVRTATIAGFGGVVGLFLYGTVLAPALAGVMPGIQLGEVSLLARVSVVPILLALIAGTLPALRLLRMPPGATLH